MKKEFRDLLKERGRSELPAVLLASAECAPLSKTGGLADVVGTLPKALRKLGMDARVITPYHRVIKDKYADRVEHMFTFYARLGWRSEYVGIEKLVLDGVTIYLVDNEHYFGDKIYRGGDAELEQYAFFTRSVLDAIPNLDFRPEVVHCNDWH
ncbi:MAG: glycogen/starch synthase, partial [Oscillospiraceae bacterium]|nr:glycogen/starch synthase [Oscillospiraceae bacterium]